MSEKIKITFEINEYSMGMNPLGEPYSEGIRIDKPYNIIKIEEYLDKVDLDKYDSKYLLSNEKLQSFDYLPSKNIYILDSNDYLVGIPHDKSFAEILSDLDLNSLHFLYFYNHGGASFYCNEEGMRLQVPSNEQIHQYDKPHVHVYIGYSKSRYVRYTISDNAEKYKETDRTYKEFENKEKKIQQAIKTSKEVLLKQWKQSTLGYILPSIDENGQTSYPES